MAMSLSRGVVLCVLSSLALGGPASAQKVPTLDTVMVLQSDLLLMYESCAAFLTYERTALPAQPRTEFSAAAIKDAEGRAAEMADEARRIGALRRIAPETIDKAIQAKADVLPEIAKRPQRDRTAFAEVTAKCFRELDTLRILRGMRTRTDPKAAPKEAAPKEAGAREEGDALLASAAAADLFENLSRADTPIVLRHKASGLVCIFKPHDRANRLVLFEARAPGDDVGCTASGPPGGVSSWYARRNSGGETLDQALDRYVQDFQLMSTYAKPFPLPAEVAESPLLKNLASPKLPASRTARFLVEGLEYTSVTVVLVKDWVVVLRASTRPSQSYASAGDWEPAAIADELRQMTGQEPPVEAPKTVSAQ
jgi:hypothetical protein